MQGSKKNLNVEGIGEFRRRVKQARETDRTGWEETRKLVSQPRLAQTLSDLAGKVQQSSLPQSLKERVLESLPRLTVERVADLPHERLKELTGLPATKAVRALCLLFDVNNSHETQGSIPGISPSKIEDVLESSDNPYDLLQLAESPSLLDLGAGDLTFEQELVERYLPTMRGKGEPFVLHAVDRLQPGSHVGGVYHADPHRKRYLHGFSEKELRFKFWGGVDLVDLSNVVGLLSCYTIVTCHAPANPAFAFEPTRLSQDTILTHLRKDKGEFRRRRVGKEDVLEVFHEGRVLTFPPWKFDVVGPLALLSVMTCRGGLCVLSSVDGEVFWETLAQLLDDERYRPRDVLFSSHTLRAVFGSIHTELSKLPIGGRIRLSDLAELRKTLPRVTHGSAREALQYGLGYVEIRRGATFDGVPSSFTSRQFANMKEEEPPWWIILVPTSGQNS